MSENSRIKKENFPHNSVKIGVFGGSSQTIPTKKNALNINDFHHYKISSLKIFYSTSIYSIEIQYQQLNTEHYESFFVDSFQSQNKHLKDVKLTTYTFGKDEEIVEFSGRTGSYIDQIVLKTSRGKKIIAGNDSGGAEFSHKSPFGYCFTLIKSCTMKDFIEGLEVDVDLSPVFRLKIYKVIEEKKNDELFNEYFKMEKNIEVNENLFRKRFDFESFEDNTFYMYKFMRTEVKKFFQVDKLGLMKYYLKYLYLDEINSVDLIKFSDDVLFSLKEIYKLLKHPRLLLNEINENNNEPIKLEEIFNKKSIGFSKEHPIFKRIFKLLILVNKLLESPSPFASGFSHLKTLLLNINDLYMSYLITLIQLQQKKQESPEAFERIKELIKPNITAYGHHIGFYTISEQTAKILMDFSRNFFKMGELTFQRVNSQDLFYYERQMLTHCFNRKLFNLPSVPSTLIGIRQFRANKIEKPNESFFLMSYEPSALAEMKPLEILTTEEMIKINEVSFATQLISSIFCSPLESLSARYVFDDQRKEIIRIPNWTDPSMAIKLEDAALRNPLYVIDLPQVLKPMPLEFVEKLQEFALEKLFVEFLAWIKLETYLISFEYFEQETPGTGSSESGSSELKNNKKVPLFSLAEETLSFLYRCCIHNLAFIKDNWHLKLIDILFHLNPVVSLCQEQLLKYFPDHQTRLKQMQRFEFDVIFARSPMDIKKLYRPKIRKYTEKIKRFTVAKGKLPLSRTVAVWLKNFPLNKLENDRIEGFLSEMLRCLPFVTNYEIYTHWNSYMNWDLFLPFLMKNSKIMDFLIEMNVQIKMFKSHIISPFRNLLDLITEKPESEINDLSIFDVYIKKAGFNPDEGYPFILTPFERAVGKESHLIIRKLLDLGAGKRANQEILHQYVIKFYENDDYELLSKENIKESIKLNIAQILNMHPLLKWRLVWELMKKKPENPSDFKSLISCENEEIYIDKSKTAKLAENSDSFLYKFVHNELKYELFFDNEPKFHGLHLGITSLIYRLMGTQACVIPTKFIKDTENNCYEIKPFFPEELKVFRAISNEYATLNGLNFEDICERIIINIVFLAGEIAPGDEIIQITNEGKQRLLPWDFAKLFANYYFGDEPKYQRHFMKTISYLLCLDEMKQTVSQEFRARIMYIDLFKVLDEWLHEISHLHWKMSHFRQGIKKEEEYLGVLFKQNMVSFLVFRFLKLQNYLGTHQNPTLFEIFKHLDPEISTIYERLKGGNYHERYNSLLTLANQELEEFKYTDYNIYLQIKNHISREMMMIFKQEEMIGPEDALLELKMIREGFTKDKIALNLLEFQKIPDFDLILFALRSFDFENIEKSIQEKWINEGLIKAFEIQLHSYSEKAMSLKLKNMSFLTVQSLEKMPLLKQIRCLILQGCNLSDEVVILLAAECPLLESLDLSFNQSLKNFEQNSNSFNIFANLSQKNAIHFQSLKHLNLKNCENLYSFVLQADLESVCLQDCKKLQVFRIDTISYNHSLDYADFQGTISFPEKDFLKLISTNYFEIKLDERTCKGAFAAILKEFPTYPKIPENPSSKSPKHRIPAKLLDAIFLVLDRPENKHLLSFLSVKEMTDVELAKLCSEVNKKLPDRNLVIKYIDISNNKNIQLTANVSMMKTVASGGFPYVEILDLSGLSLNNSIFVKLFGEWLKMNKVMKKLILNEVSIKNEDLSVIFEAINKKNVVLESLSLKNNSINQIGFQSVASFLENNSTLKYLDLSYNNFEEKSIKLLFKALTYNKSLLGLTLKAINPNKIKNNPELTAFYIQDELVDDIRDALNNNRFLKGIDLRNHPISQAKAESLYKILQMSNSLSVIKLKSSFCDIEGAFKKNKQLLKNESANNSNNQFILSSILNQSNISFHRNNSYLLEKTHKNVLPDTWVFGLSIDGGGMRGIIPAILMECIVKNTKYELFETFDYIGGSSIGGILALGSAGTLDGTRPICVAEECVNIFTNHGKDIFGRVKNKMDPLGIMANKYSEAGLESVIKKYFKNSFLSETLTNVLVTSVNKNNNEMMIFDSRKAFRDPEYDFFMRNVARATSAAPTFFPAAEFYNLVGSKFYSLVDGGVGKNDPTYFVFEGVKSIAENYGIPQKFSVISLGTGEIADQKVLSQNAGVMEVKNLLNKCIDTHTELDQAIFKEKYGNTRYRRFQTVLKFGKNQDISLDNVEPELVKLYKSAAYEIAEDFLIESYGEFQNISLVDWLAENTARKKELI